MSRNLQPVQIAKLVQVQHVRKAAAEVALGVARNAEAVAFEAHRDAENTLVEAHHNWLEHLTANHFDPERARDLAACILLREVEMRKAAIAHETASSRHLYRQDEWRMGVARADLADAMFRDARRLAMRAREERRMADLADRITYRWTHS
jgi:hypothetical protein